MFASLLTDRMDMRLPVKVIGIAGPSGSGKSTLCTCLQQRLGACSVLQQDWYFLDSDDVPDDANFCQLEYLDVARLVHDVNLLRAGTPATVPSIDPRTFQVTDGVMVVEPRPYLLVEGMTVFRIPEIAEHWDLKIYLSPGFHAIRRRKWSRDRLEREKSPEIIRNQLRWVKEEYFRDLASLPPDVHVLTGPKRPAEMCAIALGIIAKLPPPIAGERGTPAGDRGV